MFQKIRTLVRRDFDALFERYDVLVTPTTPTVAFPIGDRLDDPMSMYAADSCTIPANLAGLPAVSVPCGFHEGLPVGLQFMARPFAEDVLLRAAHTFEQEAGFAARLPGWVKGEGVRE